MSPRMYILIGLCLVLCKIGISSSARPQAGRNQKHTSYMIGCGKADITFIIDQSNSISVQDMKKGKEFISDVIETLNISKDKTQVGLLSFAGRADERFRLNRFMTKKALQRETRKLHRLNSPDTATHEALRMLRYKIKSRQFGSRSDATKIAILITDGASSSPAKTRHEARLLHKAGVAIFTIGVGKATGKLNETELKIIASDPDETFVRLVEDWDALQNINTILEQRSCKVPATPTKIAAYTEIPTPVSDSFAQAAPNGRLDTTCVCTCPNPGDNGYIKTGGKSAAGDQALRKTSLQPVPLTTDAPSEIPETRVSECRRADIIFVPPDSAGPVQLNKVGLFIQEITKSVVTPVTNFRIGVLPYRCKMWIGMKLNEYKNKYHTINRLSRWSFNIADTAKLLSEMRLSFKAKSHNIYNRRNKNKKDPSSQPLRKVAVVILDHPSDDVVNAIDEARSAQEEGVEVYVVAVGKEFNTAEARSISSLPSRTYFLTAESYSVLSLLVPKMVENLTRCLDIATC